MTIRQRLQELRRPSYRTKLFVFLILGVTFILASFLVTTAPWSDFLFEFSITFVAVSILQIIWDLLGGDPMENRITEMMSANQIMGDIATGNLGITRVWPNRRKWQRDSVDGQGVWYGRIGRAKQQVDIMGNTLWNNWFTEREQFVEPLFDAAARGVKARILVYMPGSAPQLERSRDEGLEHGHRAMQGEILSTIERFWKYYSAQSEMTRQNIAMHLTDQYQHYANTIHCDGHMLIVHYLHGEGGGPSPTIQVSAGGTLFETYERQFQYMWDHSTALTADLVEQIMREKSPGAGQAV